MESTIPDSLDDWDGDGSSEELDDGLDETAVGNDSSYEGGEGADEDDDVEQTELLKMTPEPAAAKNNKTTSKRPRALEEDDD